MLEIRVKQAGEILLEKKLRNPIQAPEVEIRPKSEFFRSKMKDIIDYHLDFSKKKSKILSEEEYDEIQKFNTEEIPKKVHRKRSKSLSIEISAEPKQLREALLSKISSFEKISGLVKSASRVLCSLESISSSTSIEGKLENLSSILKTIQETTEKEINSFHHILTVLDTFSQKQAAEMLSSKKTLQAIHEATLLSIKEKYENKLKALQQHNKILSSQQKENKIIKSLNDRIETLESLLSESEGKISAKTENLKQKSSEIITLNQLATKYSDEINKLKKELLELDQLNNLDRENYRSHVKEMTSEISRLQRMSEENLISHEMKLAEFQYLADSSKSRLDQALEALSKADNQIEYLTSHSNHLESSLNNENNELKNEIERLERIVFTLKDEMSQSDKALEFQQLQMSKSKEDEIFKLSKIIENLESENAVVLKSNKDLSLAKNKLETELQKIQEKQEKPQKKTEKKSKNK